MQGPAGLTAALTVCLYSLVRLHSEDVVLSREVWDSVMKGCFSLSQRKASEYLNMGRAVPAETLSCSPCCALQCVPVSQRDCVSSASRVLCVSLCSWRPRSIGNVSLGTSV